MPRRDDRPAGGPTARTITSLQNDSVKLIRSLEMRKARRETGLFIAEGAAVLVTARDNGWTPRMLVHGPGADGAIASALIAWAQTSGADSLDVSQGVLEKLAAKENPQSLIGVFEQRWQTPPDATAVAAGALWLALEEIRDPGNLGTILRTADAAGVAGVILVGQTCDPYAREAVRASMGSIFSVPIVRMEAAAFHGLAGAWPGAVAGTHLSGSSDFRTATYRGPVLLVMGNEGAGLTEATAAMCSTLVKIPMLGRLDSLNLAVATALMLYEIRRPVLRLA